MTEIIIDKKYPGLKYNPIKGEYVLRGDLIIDPSKDVYIEIPLKVTGKISAGTLISMSNTSLEAGEIDLKGHLSNFDKVRVRGDLTAKSISVAGSCREIYVVGSIRSYGGVRATVIRAGRDIIADEIRTLKLTVAGNVRVEDSIWAQKGLVKGYLVCREINADIVKVGGRVVVWEEMHGGTIYSNHSMKIKKLTEHMHKPSKLVCSGPIRLGHCGRHQTPPQIFENKPLNGPFKVASIQSKIKVPRIRERDFYR